MTPTSRALAAVSASLIADHDIAGTLTSLVRGCVESLGAVCGGVMVVDAAGRFELLASSSHEAAEIELYEAQLHRGPSVRAWETSAPTVMAIDDGTWPELTAPMVAAGVVEAVSAPLRWNGGSHGALTIFAGRGVQLADEATTVVQAFADMAMLVIVHTDRVTIRSAAERVEEALTSRILIEQAKGVLAYQHTISMAKAFEALRLVASDQGITLTEAAQIVIRRSGPA